MSYHMRFRYVTRLDHEFNMRRALAEAKEAQCEGDRPAAAVLVDETGHTVAATQSRVVRDGDATAHATLALVKEASRLRGGDLSGCTVYTTVEPCPMCMAAMSLAGVGRVVYGAAMTEVRERWVGPASGAWMPAELVNEFADPKPQLTGGVLSDECAELFKASVASVQPVRAAG